MMADEKRLYSLLSDLLSYPEEDLPEKVSSCLELLSSYHLEGEAALREFLAFLEENDLGKLQELYTRTFDLNPVCSLYTGHHLFGESYRRSEYLVKLKGTYRAEGFPAEGELPDHLPLLLRYLSMSREDPNRRAFILEGILPALEAMTQSFQESRNVYGKVLGVVKTCLSKEASIEGGV
jgi:nitrate reductase delta subunit